MAQVPYSPVPSVAPSEQGLPESQPNIPAAAFGGDIATAISGMGKEISGAGNEIYERAVWLQNLNNQAEARTAAANYTIAAGQEHTKFASLEGAEAVKAYPAYAKRIKELRQSIGSGLSTRMSSQMFDSESLGTLSHMIVNGGSHAAAAQKQYVKQSFDADVTTNFETAAQNPKDTRVFNSSLEKAEGSIRQKGQLEGLPPEAVENNVGAVRSKFWAGKFENLAKEAPFVAQREMYDNRDKMTAADFKRTEAMVGAQVHAVGAANISRDILATHTDDEGNLTAPISELQAKAKELAKQMSPDDPLFQNQVVKALDSEFNQRKYAARQEKWDNTQVVDGAIQRGATTVQDVLNDPQAYAAYKALPPSERLKVPGKINAYIKARDRDYNERAMTEITGLRNNDVEAFLNLDPTADAYKLNQGQIRTVMEMQQKIKKQTAQDPRVDRAMGWLRTGFGPQLEALGTFRRTQQNKADYDHLTGAVQQALDIWTEDHKKPPTNQEFNEKIAPQVLKVTKEPGMFGVYGGPFGNDRTIFKHDTSSKEYQNFVTHEKEAITTRGGSEPSDEELYKAYTRVQLLKLYPPKRRADTGE